MASQVALFDAEPGGGGADRAPRYSGTRTDVHRPSAIRPEEYVYVGQECVKIFDLGDCEYIRAERERIREHMTRTGGTYSRHEHGGNCMVCGSVNAVYTILFYHAQSNTYVRLGEDCARKMEMGGDLPGGDFDTSAFRAAVHDARLQAAGKRKAALVLADAGHAAAWALYCAEWPEGGWKREETTIIDIVGRLVKWGDISDKAMAYVGSLLARIAERPERAAREAAERATAAPCPSGRMRVTGQVLTVKVVDSEFGSVTKVLVKDETGFKVWGSRPSGSGWERGDRVTFMAACEPSKDDRWFGFYKRPTQWQTVTRAADGVGSEVTV